MRTALFSDKERKMLQHFLDTGEKMKDFRILEFRIRTSRKLIVADYELMKKYFARAQGGTEA